MTGGKSRSKLKFHYTHRNQDSKCCSGKPFISSFPLRKRALIVDMLRQKKIANDSNLWSIVSPSNSISSFLSLSFTLALTILIPFTFRKVFQLLIFSMTRFQQVFFYLFLSHSASVTKTHTHSFGMLKNIPPTKYLQM